MSAWSAAGYSIYQSSRAKRLHIPIWALRRLRPTTCSSRQLARPGKILKATVAGNVALALPMAFGAASDDIRGTEVIAEFADQALDRSHIRCHQPAPEWVWPVETGAHSRPISPGLGFASRPGRHQAGKFLAQSSLSSTTWTKPGSSPKTTCRLYLSPLPRWPTSQSWDGQTAVVEHDGSCMLVMRRTYYPGWFYRVNGGPELPVLKVNGGLQGAELVGSGTSHVLVRYRPTGIGQSIAITLTALAAAVFVVVATGLKAIRGSHPSH